MSVGRNRRCNWRRVDLGLEVAMHHAAGSERLSHRQIAAWCDCNHQTIANIEKRALVKLRKALAV